VLRVAYTAVLYCAKVNLLCTGRNPWRQKLITVSNTKRNFEIIFF